jgi:PAS domain S-box-containing protein
MSLDGISRFNYKTGLFDYLSPSATGIVGYSVEELLYLDKAAMHAMIHPDDLHGMLAEIERLEKTGEATAEYRQIHKNGTYVWMSNHMSIVRDDEGSPIYRYGSHRNITESKRAEEEVKKTNAELAKRTREVQDERQRFFDVLETLPVMVCMITPDYHIPFTNKAFREKFGEAEGRYCYDYCCGDTLPCTFCEALIPLETGRPHQWEFTSPDGNIVLDVHDFPFTDIDGTTLILEMDIDITERKRIEDQLKFQANLLSSVHDGIIAVDENMTITYWNESAEKISGWTVNEATGRSGKEIFANMGVDRLYGEMTAELNSLGFYYKEVWVYRKDGDLLYADLHMKRIFDKNGKFRGTITTFRDITERKKAEERINQQNSILQAINGVYEKSVTCATQQELGKECLRIIHSLLGNGAGLIAEVGDERILHDITFDLGQESPGLPEGMAMHSRMNGAGIVGLYRSVIENAQTVLTNDPSSHPDSTGIPQRHFKIKSFLGVPFIRERKVLGLIGVANKEGGFNEKDRVLLEAITPSILEVLMLKKTEEELQKSERQALSLVKKLEIADKNKDQFIGVLSHELRNPLAVISAGVQLLDVTQDKSQTAMVKEIINRQTTQLCKLVDDLLELTRISHNKIKLKKESINLNDIVKSAVEDTRLEYDKKGVRIETQIQANPVLLNADPVRITQAVGNILTNALKFTQANGTVRIMLQMDKDCAIISVNDNGIGISPEILPHLFTPFTQADNTLERSGGGLGLGLSIVKGIVDLHEGSVNAYSDGLGKGSTFTIRLPIMPRDNSGKEKITSCNSYIKNLKLLIIEDNKDFADLLCAMLSTVGYEARIAYDGIEGIKLAKQNKPDIIFCDIGLPGINGYDIAKIVKADESLKNSFLVALTGYARDEDVKLAIESGFDKHLAKPVDIKLLTQTINESGNRNTRDSSLC